MKTKKTFLNLICEVIPMFIVSILGIYKLKIFIQILGNETLGLYQLFSQIMIYVAVVDGGLGSALLYALYRPNSLKDDKKINQILAGGYKIFSLLGIIIFGIAAAVAFFVPFLIKDYSFNYLYIVLCFILFSLSNVIGYFFVPFSVLFEVKEKKYVVSLCTQIGQIVQSILEIVLLLIGCPFISILVMHSVIKLLSNIILLILFKRNYPQYNVKSKDIDVSFSKQIKHLLVHKINGLVSYNIDVLIISKLLGLASVAIYSTYNYIINMLRQILDKISGSMLAIIGNSLVTDTKHSKDIFNELNSLMYFIAICICVPLFFAINLFIDLWYEGSIQTNIFIGAAFSLYLFGFIIKIPITTYVSAAGLFKETKKCAIADTVINLILSLVLVWKFGICGVVLATFISVFIAEYIMKNLIIHKYVFKESSLHFYLKNLRFVVILIFDLFFSYLVINMVNIPNIFTWFLFFFTYFSLNTLSIYFIFKTLKENNFVNRFNYLIKKG